MNDDLCFVQFLHPGGEARPKRGESVVGWNEGAHKRKFIVSPGRYTVDAGGKEITAVKLCFWAEWEPPSDADPLPMATGSGLLHEVFPTYLHHPHYVKKPGGANTDPFVFGDRFLYSNCKQNSDAANDGTRMRHLKVGSVILFGSGLGGKFVLDTVFVVESWIEHDKSNYKALLRGKVPDAFWPVTLYPHYGDGAPETQRKKGGCGSGCAPATKGGCLKPPCPPQDTQTWRLYFGATPKNPVSGMFSFFPAKPGIAGFPRPVIAMDEISDELKRGIRATTHGNLQAMKELWDKVVTKVLKQGCRLGTYAELPPLRK